jgi:hypothetical protein
MRAHVYAMPLTDIKPFMCRVAKSSGIVVKLQQFTVTSIKDTNGRDTERLTACYTEFTVNDRSLVNSHFRVTCTQVVDVFGWTVRCEENKSSVSTSTRIKRLTLSKQ